MGRTHAAGVRPHNAVVSEASDALPALRKARSLLMILLATCQETLLALEAASNVLDTQLTSDLSTMIKRSDDELKGLNEQIHALGG